MELKTKSYLQATVAMIFRGSAFAIFKLIIPDPLTPITYSALGTWLSVIVLFIFLGCKGEFRNWFRYFFTNWRINLIFALIHTSASILELIGLSETTAINQSIIGNSQTLFVIFFNVLIFHQKPSKKFITGTIIAFLGIFFLFFNSEFSSVNKTWFGDILSIIAYLLWGLYNSILKPYTSRNDPLFIIISIIFITSFYYIPICIFFGQPFQILSLNLNQWAIIFFLVIFIASVSNILWIKAMGNPELKSEQVVLISCLLPIVGILTSIILLGEIFTWNIAVGCSILIIGIIYANREIKPTYPIKYTI